MSLILIIPMLIGMFSTLDLFGNNLSLDSSSSLTTPLGEGQNPLIDNIVPDSPQINDDKDEVQPVSETTEFVKKSYEEYFTDNNISSDVSTTTITGTGKKDNPYQIKSTNDYEASLANLYLEKYLKVLNNYKDLFRENELLIKIDESTCCTISGKFYNWNAVSISIYYSYSKTSLLK